MFARNLALLLAAAALTGCSGSQDAITSGTTTPPEFKGSYTLQGTVMNAVTGEHLGGTDLQMFLVQGNDIRSPDRLRTDGTDPLVGEYAFKDIPADYNATNKTYKLVVIKPGFVRFEGEITFRAADNGLSESIVDTIYNRIGNVYLFPTGTVAPSYEVTVTFNGKPVPSAPVYLEVAADTTGSITDTHSVIAATPGYVQALSGTTDASGNVTFAGSQLALGVNYQAVVAPVVFEGVQLGLANATAFIAGFGDAAASVALQAVVPGTNKYGLYVVSASNAVQGQVDPTGTLTIVFSRPVALNVPATGAPFGAVLANTTTGQLDATTPASVTLSQDGRTLTLQPRWVAQPAAADRGVTITYSDGAATLSVAGYPGDTFPVFGVGGVPTLLGGNVSGTVRITAP